eukprot:scaffold246459_cov36-Tisochrysis_lutea.AAC.2
MNPKHLYSELWLIASSPLRGRFSLKLTEAIHGILTLPHFKRPFSVEMVYAMKPLRDIKEKATEKGFHMSTVHDSSSHLEGEGGIAGTRLLEAHLNLPGCDCEHLWVQRVEQKRSCVNSTSRIAHAACAVLVC